ncbi:hypothetical protein [Salipiger sp. PrR002]|jgi:hypothetical protein|uniref:hypothetical protein n=1 Tax=Salipiger sp. PrR002 TaxID=2706489 RepID=UPI0013BBB39A|nr:hypothetical protein [Salipiger sp. PrR002]NDW02742.1 hypothetical protein [Salipiger sp. PrR002]NDW60001.1 hypothetical protein [Salipiger sp. PrR004]
MTPEGAIGFQNYRNHHTPTLAAKVSDCDDPSWLNSPPYAISEMVFDEDDVEGCWVENA